MTAPSPPRSTPVRRTTASTTITVPAPPPAVPFATYDSAAAAMAAVQIQTAGAAFAGLAWDPQRHVLGRLGFGLQPAAAVPRFDPDVWWAQQTDPAIATAPYGGVAGLTDAMPTLLLDPLQTRTWVTVNTSGPKSGVAMQQLNYATALLQAFSPFQLYEVLVDLFANHLNVVNMTEGNDYTRVSCDRDVIRAHVFGRFADMLAASARDAAMLAYLNNDVSCGKRMNENYGREILELHTVGAFAGYSQDDVVNSARILTGRARRGPMYQYQPDQHWTGPVTVMGFSDPNPTGVGGEAVGDRYVDYLAHHPATARTLARKLCVRLVSDTPSDTLVGVVAQAYLDNDTQILPMVRTILCSSEFWASRGAKPRRPLENVMGLVRGLGVTPAGDLQKAGATLASMLTHAGQQPFWCSTPNGYSLVGSDWLASGTWVDLWQIQQNLIEAKTAGALTFDGRAFVAAAARTTVAETWNVLAQQLIGTALQPGQLAALAAHFGDLPTTRFLASGLQKRPLEALMLIVRIPQLTVC